MHKFLSCSHCDGTAAKRSVIVRWQHDGRCHNTYTKPAQGEGRTGHTSKAFFGILRTSILRQVIMTSKRLIFPWLTTWEFKFAIVRDTTIMGKNPETLELQTNLQPIKAGKLIFHDSKCISFIVVNATFKYCVWKNVQHWFKIKTVTNRTFNLTYVTRVESTRKYSIFLRVFKIVFKKK